MQTCQNKSVSFDPLFLVPAYLRHRSLWFAWFSFCSRLSHHFTPLSPPRQMVYWKVRPRCTVHLQGILYNGSAYTTLFLFRFFFSFISDAPSIHLVLSPYLAVPCFSISSLIGSMSFSRFNFIQARSEFLWTKWIEVETYDDDVCRYADVGNVLWKSEMENCLRSMGIWVCEFYCFASCISLGIWSFDLSKYFRTFAIL